MACEWVALFVVDDAGGNERGVAAAMFVVECISCNLLSPCGTHSHTRTRTHARAYAHRCTTTNEPSRGSRTDRVELLQWWLLLLVMHLTTESPGYTCALDDHSMVLVIIGTPDGSAEHSSLCTLARFLLRCG